MQLASRSVQWQTRLGTPLVCDDFTVTPQSQALVVRGTNSGFVWNRPVALLVEREGVTERVPIIDVTRIAQIGIVVMGLVFGLVSLIVQGSQTSTRRQIRSKDGPK